MANSRALDPTKCALLIIDMQRRFEPVARSISKKLGSFGRLCLEKKIPVFMTLHHDEPSKDTELVKFWGDDIRIKEGSQDWSFIPALESLSRQEGVVIIDDKTA